MTTEHFPINVLILGKTGVGKSSLLNYIFETNHAETGSGPPVTEAKIIRHPPFSYGELDIAIHDSWGLEPDKAADWRRIIEDEVRRNAKKEIRDWFHTIVYCIDAKRSRLDDFELEIIRNLVSEGNRLVFAFTKSDVAKDNEKKALQDILEHEGWQLSVIPVCACKRRLLNGKITEPTGRNDLLAAICRNFSENMFSKALAQYMDNLDKSLDNAIQIIMSKFDKNAGPLGIFTCYGDELRIKMENTIRLEFKIAIEITRQKLFNTLKTIANMEALLMHNISIHTSPQWINEISMETAKIDLQQTCWWNNSSENNFKEFVTILVHLPFLFTGIRKDLYRQDLINFCLEQKQNVLSRHNKAADLSRTVSTNISGFSVTHALPYFLS